MKDVTTSELKTFSLRSNNGLEATLLNYGGRLVSLRFPNAQGHLVELVLNYPNLSNYLTDPYYLGALVGRYANRIAAKEFCIGSRTLQLEHSPPNQPQLHGGPIGFHNVFWQVAEEELNDTTLTLHYFSRDMESGYPGNLKVEASFQLTDDNAFSLRFQASCDQDTIFNPSFHPYWNLHGRTVPILDHRLQVHAQIITPVQNDMIPTGEFMSVEQTPFDFRSPKPIGESIEASHPQLTLGRGYDHNYVLKKTTSAEVSLAAEVFSPQTGIHMSVHTNAPGLQVYTGNYLASPFMARSGFCLEPQYFPDSPHHAHFPSTVLRAGKTFESQILYRFKVL